MDIQQGWQKLGESHQGRAISAYSNFMRDDTQDLDKPWTLILGGTHGDESATVPFLETFVEKNLLGKFELGPTMVIPVLNPDGYAESIRYNGRGVDLNRNFPAHWRLDSEEPTGPHPLSENESQLLHMLLAKSRPSKVVSLHWALSELDADGEGGIGLAQGMWEALKVEQRALFGLNLSPSEKPLPGSLGSFLNNPEYLSHASALVTVELPYHPEPNLDALPENHLDIVKHIWQHENSRYWNTVYPAVEALLRYAVG